MSRAADEKRQAVIDAVVRGPGTVPAAARQAAFDNTGVDERARALVDKVARNAWKVTDGDVSAAQAAGLSDDEIFELAVSAALGQASRQRQRALDALDAATAAGGTR